MVIDHFSRRAIGFAVFSKRPTSLEITAFLEKAISSTTTPKYLICDQDKIFIAGDFKRWLRRKRTKPRYGAVGQHGSSAVIERFIRTMKDETLERIMVPTQQTTIRCEIRCFIEWYNENRPHSALNGQTPNEVYNGARPANRQPRKHWQRRLPCANPRTRLAGKSGTRFTLAVNHHAGRSHLSIVSLQRAA